MRMMAELTARAIQLQRAAAWPQPRRRRQRQRAPHQLEASMDTLTSHHVIQGRICCCPLCSDAAGAWADSLCSTTPSRTHRKRPQRVPKALPAKPP